MSKFILLIILLFVITSCVSAPKETVELSEVVNKQIAQMQSSHEKFVHLYYNKLRDDVDNFIRLKWIPQFMTNIIEEKVPSGKKFRNSLDDAYKLSTINWNNVLLINNIQDTVIQNAVKKAIIKMSTENNALLGNVLINFANATQKQINLQRAQMLQPINEQENYVIDQLRQGYNDILQGTSTIKAYLASVVNVVKEQDAILNKVGLLDTQRKIINTAVSLNDSVMVLTNTIAEADSGVTKFLDGLKKINNTIKDIK